MSWNRMLLCDLGAARGTLGAGGGDIREEKKGRRWSDCGEAQSGVDLSSMSQGSREPWEGGLGGGPAVGSVSLAGWWGLSAVAGEAQVEWDEPGGSWCFRTGKK